MGIFDFASLRRSIQNVEAQLKKMQDELADLTRQRERVLSAPASKDDLKALLSGWVAGNGDKYRTALRETLAQFVRNPRNMSADRLARMLSVSGAAQPNGEALRVQDVDQALCALFAPLLNSALMEQVDAMPWPDDAISDAQRKASADKLEQRIVALQKEINDLINSAEEAGITWSR